MPIGRPHTFSLTGCGTCYPFGSTPATTVARRIQAAAATDGKSREFHLFGSYRLRRFTSTGALTALPVNAAAGEYGNMNWPKFQHLMGFRGTGRKIRRCLATLPLTVVTLLMAAAMAWRFRRNLPNGAMASVPFSVKSMWSFTGTHTFLGQLDYAFALSTLRHRRYPASVRTRSVETVGFIYPGYSSDDFGSLQIPGIFLSNDQR